MLKSLTALIGAAVFAVPLNTTLVQTNLLLHSDSAWTADWTAGYGCSIARDDGDGPVLRQSLPADFTRGNHSWHQSIPVQPGASYRFTAQYKLTDVQKAMAQFHFAYPDGKMMSYLDFRFSTPLLSGTQDQWQSLIYDFKAPKGAAAVQVALRLDSPGTICWKDVSLVKTGSSPDLKFVEDEQDYDLRDSVGLVVRELPVDELLAVNAKWMRYNINWASVEGDGPGQWNEEYLGRVQKDIETATEAGIHVMVSLGYAPRWAARKNEGVRGGFVVARDQNQWMLYVAVIVGRLNHLVDTYRIMNEVNHQWDSGSQPQEYTVFLQNAYRTIKAVSPEATVLMAGVSGTPGGYLNAIYQSGGREFFDVAACQPYMHGRSSPEEGRLADRLRAYRMVMVENDDTAPIWATEYGYPSEPLDRISPEQQAAWSVRSHLLAISSGAGVNKFYFYLLRDQDGDTISQTGGLYTRDWQIKPLGLAVGTLAELINPVRRYVGEVDLGDDPALYNRLFEADPGQYVWALWRTGGQSEISLEFTHPVQVVSWDGDAGAAANTHTVTVGELPVYIVGDMPDIAARAHKGNAIGYGSIDATPTHSVTVPWTSADAPDWTAAPTLELKAKRAPERGSVARAQTVAAEDGLWVRAEIEDDSPAFSTVEGFAGIWTQDSVEVFLNFTPENAPAGFVTDQCYHYIASPGISGDDARLYLASVGSRARQELLPDNPPVIREWDNGQGYTMSFFIPWDTAHKPHPDETVGFDVLVTRSDEDGNREETAVWSGSLDNSTDASLWGNLRFVEKR
jgi:hypothetical protein